ncbi:hypothetical protein [Pseudovibrio japonicus]|nr:hypothetical protein [Pseudovibrio japonicus]
MFTRSEVGALSSAAGRRNGIHLGRSLFRTKAEALYFAAKITLILHMATH